MSDMRPVDRIGSWAGRLPAWLLPGLVPVLAGLGGWATDARYKVPLFVVAALAAGGAAARMTWQERVSADQIADLEGERDDAIELAESSATAQVLLVGDALAPLATYLAAMAAEPSAERRGIALGRLEQAVVGAVAALLPGARSMIYLLDAQGIPRQAAFAGAGARPREAFDPASPDGRQILGMIARNEALLVEDVRDDPRVTPRSGYRTVAAVAVVTGSRAYGMLTVDAPMPGSLDGTHLRLLQLLAPLLATGLALDGRDGLPLAALAAHTEVDVRTVGPRADTAAVSSTTAPDPTEDG